MIGKRRLYGICEDLAGDILAGQHYCTGIHTLYIHTHARPSEGQTNSQRKLVKMGEMEHVICLSKFRCQFLG